MVGEAEGGWIELRTKSRELIKTIQMSKCLTNPEHNKEKKMETFYQMTLPTYASQLPKIVLISQASEGTSTALHPRTPQDPKGSQNTTGP